MKKLRGKMQAKNYGKIGAFTIVELLVVIVVIGILAAITIVSYSGISKKAIVTSLQSDLDNNAKVLKMYNVEYGYYPNTLDGNKCPLTPTADTRYCLKTSTDTTLTYVGGAQLFTVIATKNSIDYQITESSSPQLSSVVAGPDWITIGTQTWAKVNLNVGTMITGATAQTNNSILEKHCYNNTESNCTTYGGLYQWNEAMQYIKTDGAKGICPAGSHIPTDNDWKILEIYLGMTQAQADAIGDRGTNQGTQLKSGGSSGLNIVYAGVHISSNNTFIDGSMGGSVWSSTESGARAYNRLSYSGYATMYRNTNDENNSYSVRCLGN